MRQQCGIRRRVHAFVGVGITAAGLILALTPVTGHADPVAGESSAVTVSGSGAFADLKVTVSQTKHLINQTITVSWTGGKPTQPVSGDVYANYLQIMQCWEDPSTEKARESCQFGASYKDTRGGLFANSRQVSYGSTLIDPKETEYTQSEGSLDQAFVPFRAVNGKVSSHTTFDTPYFDSNGTNEVPYARTRQDGSGLEFFEIQTGLYAPGLGCGEALTDSAGKVTGRSCWLVVVPRGETEVNGTPVSARSPQRLESSPLSSTNWANRIAVKLEFEPMGGVCPIGAHERLLEGVEIITEAVGRWMPALCANGGTVFGYSEVTDATAWQHVLSTDPKMVFTSAGVPPDRVSPTQPLVYAPVAVSGLVVAYNIERRVPLESAPELALRDGERVAELNLNARLLAKLLTQSYRFGVAYSAKYLEKNPSVLTEDPEFLQLNPDFRDLLGLPVADVLLPLPQSQAAMIMWNWLNADPDARAFMNGTADPWGMTVNPNYKDFAPVDNFPKSDLYCDNLPNGLIPLCTLDAHPYAATMHEGARAASRGDTLARNTYDPTGPIVNWKKGSAQLPGQRAVLAITDTATAARFSLPTARLRNASGTMVAATEANMLASVSAMKPGAIPEVVQPDPTTTVAQAYPLTTVTYAATAPSALTTAAGAEYAAFVNYSVQDGQQLGDSIGKLPIGYAPLPTNLRTQALAAAKKIADLAGKAVATPSAVPVSAVDTPVGGGGAPLGNPGGALVAAPAAPAAPAVGQTPALSPSGKPATGPTKLGTVGYTPSQPVGVVRYALVIILIVGGVTTGLGPALLRLAALRSRGVGPST